MSFSRRRLLLRGASKKIPFVSFWRVCAACVTLIFQETLLVSPYFKIFVKEVGALWKFYLLLTGSEESQFNTHLLGRSRWRDFFFFRLTHSPPPPLSASHPAPAFVRRYSTWREKCAKDSPMVLKEKIILHTCLSLPNPIIFFKWKRTFPLINNVENHPSPFLRAVIVTFSLFSFFNGRGGLSFPLLSFLVRLFRPWH